MRGIGDLKGEVEGALGEKNLGDGGAVGADDKVFFQGVAAESPLESFDRGGASGGGGVEIDWEAAGVGVLGGVGEIDRAIVVGIDAIALFHFPGEGGDGGGGEVAAGF